MRTRVLSIIVNYNGAHWVLAAVESLLSQTHPTDILVVDNASTDGSAQEIMRRFSAERVCVLLTAKNNGAAGGYNYALQYPDYDFYFFLNPDADAPPDCLNDLIRLMQSDPKLGILGPTIVEHDTPDQIQEFCPKLDWLLFPDDELAGKTISQLPEVPLARNFYACAAAMLVRQEAFAAVGGCDEDFFMFADESDLSWRMRLVGWETAVTPLVRVRHVGGATAIVGKDGSVYKTSLRRIFLRERNSMWMAIKCFATPTLILYAFANTVHLLCESLVLLLIGKKDIARSYMSALIAVFRTLPRTLAKRAEIQRSRRTSETHILSFFSRRYAKLAALKKRGVPQVVGFTK